MIIKYLSGLFVIVLGNKWLFSVCTEKNNFTHICVHLIPKRYEFQQPPCIFAICKHILMASLLFFTLNCSLWRVYADVIGAKVKSDSIHSKL